MASSSSPGSSSARLDKGWCFTCRAPRGPRCRSSAAPLYFGYASGGGQTWRWVRGFWLAGWLVVCRAESVTSPPRLRRCPPEWGDLVASSTLMLCTGASRSAVSFTRAPDANLDAQILAKKPTKPGGAARSAGGMSSHSAKPSRCAGHQPHTQRQVCPPPERSEAQGGCGDRREAAGGAGGAPS